MLNLGPFVALTAAAMLAAFPVLSPTELVEGLKPTATPNDGVLRLVKPTRRVEQVFWTSLPQRPEFARSLMSAAGGFR